MIDRWEEMRSRIEERKLWARMHDGRTFKASDRNGRAGHFIIVHVDPTSKRWRATWFDRRGPGGHAEARDYQEAVAIAVGHGADLGTAEFHEETIT